LREQGKLNEILIPLRGNGIHSIDEEKTDKLEEAAGKPM
jgi:hypothetical protein